MYFIDDLCGVPARLYLLARGMLGVLAVEVVVAVVIVVAVVVVKSVGRWFVCQQQASRRGRIASQSHKDATCATSAPPSPLLKQASPSISTR